MFFQRTLLFSSSFRIFFFKNQQVFKAKKSQKKTDETTMFFKERFYRDVVKTMIVKKNYVGNLLFNFFSVHVGRQIDGEEISQGSYASSKSVVSLALRNINLIFQRKFVSCTNFFKFLHSTRLKRVITVIVTSLIGKLSSRRLDNQIKSAFIMFYYLSTAQMFTYVVKLTHEYTLAS